nr:hypothetical transcript [Hymenolepis microstoma]
MNSESKYEFIRVFEVDYVHNVHVLSIKLLKKPYLEILIPKPREIIALCYRYFDNMAVACYDLSILHPFLPLTKHYTHAISDTFIIFVSSFVIPFPLPPSSPSLL